MRTVQDVIGSRDNNFTVIRLFLSSSVIYFHAFGMTLNQSAFDLYTIGPTFKFASLGGAAVDGFFYLSGLFVTQSLFKDHDLFKYAVRRSFRIIPGLFVCLLLTALLGGFLSQSLEGWKFLLFSDTYAYVVQNTFFDLHFYIPGIFETLPQKGAINGSIHTLGLEVKMYIWLGLACVTGMLSNRKRIALNGVIVAMLVALYPTFFTVPLQAADYGREPIAMFALGVATFGVARHLYIIWWQGPIIYAAVAVIEGQSQTVLFFIAFAWTMLFIGQSSILGRREILRTDASYGIYIYGWPCTQFVAQLDPNIHPYVLILSALVLSAIFGLVSWHIVEKPWIEFGSFMIALSRRPQILRDMWKIKAVPTAFRRSLRVGLVVLSTLLVCLAAWPITEAHPFGPRVRMPVTITNYGPSSTIVDKPFNIVGPGVSAMWFVTAGKPKFGSRVVMAGRRLEPTIGETSTSIIVPTAIYDHVGTDAVYFEHRFFDHIETSNAVTFQVKDP